MYLYMIICIIGSGGREHAICKTISLSSKASKIYCLPGNAGTQQLAENIDLDIENAKKKAEMIIPMNPKFKITMKITIFSIL